MRYTRTASAASLVFACVAASSQTPLAPPKILTRTANYEVLRGTQEIGKFQAAFQVWLFNRRMTGDMYIGETAKYVGLVTRVQDRTIAASLSASLGQVRDEAMSIPAVERQAYQFRFPSSESSFAGMVLALPGSNRQSLTDAMQRIDQLDVAALAEARNRLRPDAAFLSPGQVDNLQRQVANYQSLASAALHARRLLAADILAKNQRVALNASASPSAPNDASCDVTVRTLDHAGAERKNRVVRFVVEFWEDDPGHIEEFASRSSPTKQGLQAGWYWFWCEDAPGRQGGIRKGQRRRFNVNTKVFGPIDLAVPES